MLLEEFQKRTGFYPSAKMYEIIEAAYMSFPGDKYKFCAAYKANTNGIAQRIQKEANDEERRLQERHEKAISTLTHERDTLQKTLERELEWQSYEDPNNVKQAEYVVLAEASSTRRLSDAEAKDYLNECFGFVMEMIEIFHSVPIEQKNRHGHIRYAGQYERHPVYNASDWNYIRFDCGHQQYELKDGMLQMFRG